MNSDAYKDLETIGLVSEASIEKFASSTRDFQSLPVWRDKKSGVVFIKDFCFNSITI